MYPTPTSVILAALVTIVGFYAMLKTVWWFADRMMYSDFEVEWYFVAVLVALAIIVATIVVSLHILMGVWLWQ